MKKNAKRFSALLVAAAFFLTLPVSALSAPVAENMELTTYRGISVGGQLVAVTPDGGSVSFAVTTEPSMGTVELNENGSFVYTPRENSRGRDYFGYRATDADGQQSREATVIIRLCRQRRNLRYADTFGMSCDYAAHKLADAGLFTGSTMLGNALFEPERTVSKGEFLSLCMACADRQLLTAVESTGYEDDGELKAWLKPYVATALFDGIQADSARADAYSPILPSECAEIMNRCFGFSTVTVKAEESQSKANLRACGLWDTAFDREEPMTRSDAAIMLVKAMELRKK